MESLERSKFIGFQAPDKIGNKATPFAHPESRKTFPKDQDMETISLVIPFYNEEKGLPTLRQRLLPVIESLHGRWNLELILVDDGSLDNTFSGLSEHFTNIPGIHTIVVRHEANQGIGMALASGFSVAQGDVICTLDSDCTYAPENLPGMIDLLLSTDADIVTGSPYHPQGEVENVDGWRLMLSKGASRCYAHLAPVKLYCYTSLFRAYRREWARSEWIRSRGFLGVTEILLAASFQGAQIVEFPVKLHSRIHGQSKMRVARTVLGHLRLMINILLRHGHGLVRVGVQQKPVQGSTAHKHSLSLP